MKKNAKSTFKFPTQFPQLKMDGILNTKTLISFSRIVLKIDMYIARPLFPSKQIVSRRPAKIVKTA